MLWPGWIRPLTGATAAAAVAPSLPAEAHPRRSHCCVRNIAPAVTLKPRTSAEAGDAAANFRILAAIATEANNVGSTSSQRAAGAAGAGEQERARAAVRPGLIVASVERAAAGLTPQCRLAVAQFAEGATVEQHQLSARVTAPAPAPVPVDVAAARAAVMGGGVLVEPQSLRLDASPSVTLSLGKLTLRRPAAPPIAAARPGALLWKFRTTEPGVYAVRPAMGIFLDGRAAVDQEVVTVTRRTVSSGRRANGGGVASSGAAVPGPRLKLSTVALGPGFSRCPAGAALVTPASAKSTAGISAVWKLVADTPLLKASTVHQYVDIELTTPASLARARAAAAISSEAPIHGYRGGGARAGGRPPAAAGGFGPRAAAAAAAQQTATATESPAREEQSAGEWAAAMHQQQQHPATNTTTGEGGGGGGGSALQKVPEYFLDPILGRVFVDPVTTEVGNTYERSSIERWLASGKRTDPLTNAVLEDTRLVPNNVLRSQIQAWREAAPDSSSGNNGDDDSGNGSSGGGGGGVEEEEESACSAEDKKQSENADHEARTDPSRSAGVGTSAGESSAPTSTTACSSGTGDGGGRRESSPGSSGGEERERERVLCGCDAAEMAAKAAEARARAAKALHVLNANV